MKYPEINVPRGCFKMLRPNMQSPRAQLSGEERHAAWLESLGKEADRALAEKDFAPKDAKRMLTFWRTVRAFSKKLASGLSVQVWQVRGELAEDKGFSEDGFDTAVKKLFKIPPS